MRLKQIEAAARRQARRDRDAVRGKLGAGRFDALVKELAGVIRLAFDAGATASLWGLEGPLRHAIRSDLCLQDWRWIEADQMARDLLADAYRRVNAIRPSWNEGQLEWTIEAGTLIERTLCATCFKPLPESRPKFCSDPCNTVFHARISKRIAMTEEKVSKLAAGGI